MKKFFSVITAICFTALFLTGCSLFEQSSKKETVVIKYADCEDTLVFDTANSLYRIKPKYAAGAVLIGIYDTPDDTGEKYFDYDGLFLKGNVWHSSDPHTLYAVYEDVDYDRTYTSYVKHNESPTAVWWYAYGYRTIATFYNFSDTGISNKKSKDQMTANDKYFASLIKSNPKIKVKLKLRFMVKEKEPTDKQFRWQIKIGQESFTEHVEQIPSLWTEMSDEIEIYTQQLAIDKGEIYLLAVPSTNGSEILIKNVFYELTLQR